LYPVVPYPYCGVTELKYVPVLHGSSDCTQNSEVVRYFCMLASSSFPGGRIFQVITFWHPDIVISFFHAVFLIRVGFDADPDPKHCFHARF
jgi:hypothetical protein